MALRDYICTTCGEKLYDIQKMMGELRPVCPVDKAHGEMEWLPSFSRGRSLGFTPFDHEMDGKVERVNTIEDVRRIERESMQRAVNGEGSPTIFRAFSQDRSNYDKNVFGDGPTQGGHHRRPFITRGDHRGEE